MLIHFKSRVGAAQLIMSNLRVLLLSWVEKKGHDVRGVTGKRKELQGVEVKVEKEKKSTHAPGIEPGTPEEYSSWPGPPKGF